MSIRNERVYISECRGTVQDKPVTTFNFLKREREIMPFQAGQAVFTEGQAGDVMYAVVEGEVQIVLHGKVLETIGEGGIFGELALLDDRPRSCHRDCQHRLSSGRHRFEAVWRPDPADAFFRG